MGSGYHAHEDQFPSTPEELGNTAEKKFLHVTHSLSPISPVPCMRVICLFPKLSKSNSDKISFQCLVAKEEAGDLGLCSPEEFRDDLCT